MNILFLSRWFPFPPNNGSKIRIIQLLQGLSRFHDVTLLSFIDSPSSPLESLQHNSICSSIQVVPWKPYDSQSIKARLGFFSPLPRSLVDTYSPEMDALIRATLLKGKFDLVIASQLGMASYYPSFMDVPALFEEMELGSFYQEIEQAKNFSRRFRAQARWLKLQRYINRLLDRYHAATVASDIEFRIIARKFSAYQNKIKVLPNGLDLLEYQRIKVNRQPKHLIFSGAFTYVANYQAMQWFTCQVFPLIRKQIHDVQLIITGDHANLPLPCMENVTLAGYVDDIKSLIASCDVSLAPIWSGGGTRLKILEAMALGTPVVATSKGAEGLMAQDGTQLLIADQPEKFASHVIKLIQDEDLRKNLASSAMQLVKDNYDWEIIMPRFLRLVEEATAE
jgi:glycosyltransferase involved in cell wall biosynthesis